MGCGYNMTSRECLEMKKAYENVKDKIQNAIGYFDGCSSSILESASYLQDLIIDGKTFDDDKLNEDNSKLGDAKSNLQSIINECNEKIDHYERLYNEALNRERSLVNSSSDSDDISKEKVSSVKLPVKKSNIYKVDMR